MKIKRDFEFFITICKVLFWIKEVLYYIVVDYFKKMECWRSKSEDEMLVESTVLAEICLIHQVFFNKPLSNKTTLIFVKCNYSTLYEISKMYRPLYISKSLIEEDKDLLFEKKKVQKL